jgi:hypothetical protein
VAPGARRNAGVRDRGTVSVYTASTYTPRAASDGEDEALGVR